MNINRFRLADFRCFEAVEFLPSPGVNWLVGANGAGKTSVLEAAHILAHGRSFRVGSRFAPCRRGASEYLIYAEINRSGGAESRLGLTRKHDGWEARLDGANVASLAPLFEACPVVSFGPDSASLIQGPAEARRSFMDWSVFHVEHRSLEVWRMWRRALRQRNALLHTVATAEAFVPWEHDLGRLGTRIHAMRRACLDSLEPYLLDEAAWLVPELGRARFEYRPGWDESVGLPAQLEASRERDRERGFTQCGAHRADWSLSFEQIARREHLSRGQAKAVALVCVLAQTRWLRDRIGDYPLVCLDDLASELDASHAQRVGAWLAARPVQAWLTATGMPEWAARSPAIQAFHVEHGSIRPM